MSTHFLNVISYITTGMILAVVWNDFFNESVLFWIIVLVGIPADIILAVRRYKKRKAKKNVQPFV